MILGFMNLVGLRRTLGVLGTACGDETHRSRFYCFNPGLTKYLADALGNGQ